jgi:hypothetical protein
MKTKTSANVRDNKDIIFDLLSAEGIESFEVSFDGSGDDGSLNGIECFVPEIAEKKIKKILSAKVEGAMVGNGTRWNPDGTNETIWDENVTVEGLIEGVCYDVLQGVCAGWEINEGSYGTFYFDVKNRKVRLDFNERVMETNLTQYDF